MQRDNMQNLTRKKGVSGTTKKINEDLTKNNTDQQNQSNNPEPIESQVEIDTLFSKSTGNDIKFYSDAYNDETKSSGAFNDIFNSMSKAKESISLTGWTLSPTEKFKFQQDGQVVEITLPELFAQKAFDGTNIIAFPWKNIAPPPFKDDTVNFIPAVEAEIK